VNQILKPMNICDCDFESIPDPDLAAFNQKIRLEDLREESKTSKGEKLYKKIDGEYFIDGTTTKYELRHLNVIDISDIDIVLVSNFDELYGIPFITRLPEFKGAVIMTQVL
jgi:hypothetical protein